MREHVKTLHKNFCVTEKESFDSFYQALSIASVMMLGIGLLLGCLGSCFYHDLPEPEDYRELEMETVMGREDEDEDNTISYEWMGKPRA